MKIGIRGILAIRQQRDTIFIPVKKIDKINQQRIKIAESLKNWIGVTRNISFQRLNLESSDDELFCLANQNGLEPIQILTRQSMIYLRPHNLS